MESSVLNEEVWEPYFQLTSEVGSHADTCGVCAHSAQCQNGAELWGAWLGLENLRIGIRVMFLMSGEDNKENQ